MKKVSVLFAATAAAIAALSLGACDDYPMYHHHGPAYADDGYDVYYDDFYGPSFYDGYWDGDYYYYRTAAGGTYLRDDAHHFRRDAFNGFHSIHAHDWRNRH